MGSWTTATARCPGQYLSIRYSERLATNDIVASVGSKGDSYDNAMVEGRGATLGEGDRPEQRCSVAPRSR